MYTFDIERPATIAEAVNALGGETMPLSGGQTLIPTLKARLASPDKLVSLAGVSEMQGISLDGGILTIGGTTVHADVATNGSYPALSQLAANIGDPAVRNRGTIGGSIANNDPAACYPAAALASGATIVTNTREIAADDYFLGMFDTALEEGEIVTAVKFPIPEKANYQKFVQPASRFALVGVFVAKTSDGVRVAVTGASNEGVHRWNAAEDALAADFSAAALEGLTVSSDDMISDLHGSPEYRAHLVKVMTARAVSAAS
ncbi:xanthine dehydrogenase family protein subunit M [Sulfitobacter sp. M57]|uniref:FAD binding domain-containing protein n=1 Tax=unclassified Sulfitobacter TaxID=196795 RepID=UPI0023E3043E|nr:MULTISPECIES: xanthine dehydrogenase family protein subunit M [unclassified Sulfitobacter]MDF3416552.1 xanthine dehydrogenase family protein subunit M [Sulfitobacter sp. KE5]MDF3424008.1 xanthine dehydrogenase family protein subunit M [Sulfitobacter sp. KE43]MDF3434994.1 xanthine dehydrogenase family protein subunit M [Sulfitobacter sp. KE42]MDF3460687.1 xanthine dehydrogenase family protein subunit M [Sulfitobacter sp. S74]MDF3464641.1 xanthine dehydrogenase family protein subunit M [Sulfi